MTVLAAAEQTVADGRLDDLHDLLLRATADHAAPPRAELAAIGAQLRDASLDRLPLRQMVAFRLLAADAVDAAWEVLRDNAVGVVDERFDAATSSGARRTSWRLPLSTLVEPPKVYAWLPGLRDPRFPAPDAAYDVTKRVTLKMQLDEMWWDGPRLVLGGFAYLHHLEAAADDVIEVVFAHADGAPPVVVRGERVRRTDFVRGTGERLTQRAWAGWSASCDVGALRPAGLWKPTLRLTQQGIAREARLAPVRGETVCEGHTRAGLRRAVTRISDGDWVDLVLVDPLPIRAPRKLLHLVASRARRR